MTRFLAVLTLAIALPVVVDAQTVVRRSCYPTYSAPVTYAQPTYQQYAAPTYQYQQYQQYATYVPYVLPVELTRDYFFSISDYYRDKQLVDAMVGRLVSLGYLPQQQQPVQPQIQPSQQLLKSPAKVEVVAKIQTGVPAGLKEIVSASCLKCHGPNNAGGHVDLSNLEVVPPGVRWEAQGLVAAGVMPKTADPLPDASVLLFFEWAMEASKAEKLARKSK